MRPCSDRLRAALALSHTMVTTATVGGTALRVVGGSVSLDGKAATRGRCDLTLSASTVEGLAALPSDPLAPYGAEVTVSRGVRFIDGTEELVSLGVFRIEDVDANDSGTDFTVRVAGLDRSARVIDARFEEPYAQAAGVNVATAILAVISAAWPDVPVADGWPTVSATTAATTGNEGDDRWDFARKLAETIGADLYFDGDGALMLSTATSGGSAAATLAEGEGGVLLQAGSRWSRSGAFNRVIATSSNTSITTAPPRGVATDIDALSPTYYFGPFGLVPRFYSSPFIADDAQAASAAQLILSRELGTTRTLSLGSLVLPYLEPGDAVEVTRRRAGHVAELHTVDTIAIPMSAEATMTIGTRAVQVT